MIKKGILGGTFDPIHIGHMYIANEAVWTLELDKLIFMPSGMPPHKNSKGITEASIRLAMVEKAASSNESFEVSDYEINKRGYSYTYETLEYFQQLEGNNTRWYFITGCDCLFDLGKWKSVDRILKAATLVVFNRPGYSKEEIYKQKKMIEEKYESSIIFLDILLLDVSSTYIRTKIKEGKDASFFLPKDVDKIIKENGLYKRED